MELHSYAKRRIYQNWTVEQKRRLVETRIYYDSMFNKKYCNLADSWKTVLEYGKLEGFSVLFVRKQWSNMITKYKNLIARYANSSIVDETTAKMLDGEWEFFKPIHNFMLKKETNFHSYAQSPFDDDEDIEFLAISNENSPMNEDSTELKGEPIKEEVDVKIELKHKTPTITLTGIKNNSQIESSQETNTAIPSTSNCSNKETQTESKSKLKNGRKLSYKEKYFKYSLRSSRRMEKKINSLFQIFGQIVKHDYPNVDVSGLNCDNSENSTDTSNF